MTQTSESLSIAIKASVIHSLCTPEELLGD